MKSDLSFPATVDGELTFAPVEKDALEDIAGGMRWENLPMSKNIEDRRPKSDGGPVPDAVWRAEQRRLRRQRR